MQKDIKFRDSYDLNEAQAKFVETVQASFLQLKHGNVELKETL